MESSFLYHDLQKISILTLLKYFSSVIIILLLCTKCENSSESDKGIKPEIIKTSSIISGSWETRLQVSNLSGGIWKDLDSYTLNKFFTEYSFWKVDTLSKIIFQSSACDFDTCSQIKWSTLSDTTREIKIVNTSYKIVTWSSDTCDFQGLYSTNERRIYHLSRIKNIYSSADLRDPYCGKYKGYKKTWMRSPPNYYSEKTDSNIIFTVTKLTCSPDQIRLNSKDEYKLKNDMTFGYNKLPDGDYYQGKFSNNNLLEITTKACGGDCGTYSYLLKTN